MKQVASESDHEPEMKRQKKEESKEVRSGDKYSQVAGTCRTLQKSQVLRVGQKETLKLVSAGIDSSKEKIMVFVVHDKEHEAQTA